MANQHPASTQIGAIIHSLVIVLTKSKATQWDSSKPLQAKQPLSSKFRLYFSTFFKLIFCLLFYSLQDNGSVVIADLFKALNFDTEKKYKFTQVIDGTDTQVQLAKSKNERGEKLLHPLRIETESSIKLRIEPKVVIVQMSISNAEEVA